MNRLLLIYYYTILKSNLWTGSLWFVSWTVVLNTLTRLQINVIAMARTPRLAARLAVGIRPVPANLAAIQLRLQLKMRELRLRRRRRVNEARRAEAVHWSISIPGSLACLWTRVSFPRGMTKSARTASIYICTYIYIDLSIFQL